MSRTLSPTQQSRSPTCLTSGLQITIESINARLRRAVNARGHFPSDEAAIKLLYLGIRNITGRHIDGDGLVRERGERGTGTYGWKAAMNAFAVAFGDRVPV